MVPVTKENGCVRVIPGSHKLDIVSLLPRQAQQKGAYLEIDPEILKQHESQAVDIELQPGDILLFKQQLIHSGNPNLSEGIRWSIDWRYQDSRVPTLRKEQVLK